MPNQWVGVEVLKKVSLDKDNIYPYKRIIFALLGKVQSKINVNFKKL